MSDIIPASYSFFLRSSNCIVCKLEQAVTNEIVFRYIGCRVMYWGYIICTPRFFFQIYNCMQTYSYGESWSEALRRKTPFSSLCSVRIIICPASYLLFAALSSSSSRLSDKLCVVARWDPSTSFETPASFIGVRINVAPYLRRPRPGHASRPIGALRGNLALYRSFTRTNKFSRRAPILR
jgi:hypothetical protein